MRYNTVSVQYNFMKAFTGHSHKTGYSYKEFFFNLTVL